MVSNPLKVTPRSLIITFFIFILTACESTNKQAFKENLTNEMVAMINTSVDPAYVYEYTQTKFVPPQGKTLLMMGQTLESIDEYMDSFSGRPTPAGWAAYWGIPSIDGVMQTTINETGTSQNHQLLTERFPHSVLQSALWMVGKWDILKKAGDGEYDPVIKNFSRWAKTIERPIYLRIGYEFDGIHNQMQPQAYVKAYQRIVDIIRSEGVNNIAFVWHSYAAPTYNGYPLSAWYPGDDYVDWVGISLFGQMYENELSAESNAVFDFAKKHKKPVMVAEASPIAGIEKDNLEAWSTWFVNFLSLTYDKNIKAISFINEDWGRIKIEGLSKWKDARLQNNEQINHAWFKETSKERYLKQSLKLFNQLGYTQ